MKLSGIVIVVLAHAVPLAGCGGEAQSTDSSGAGNGEPATGGTSGGQDATSSGGTSQSDLPVCGDVAYPSAGIHIVGAPTDGAACLVDVEITPDPDVNTLECFASGEDCSCWMWNGSLVEGTTTISVLDAEGRVGATYGGPFPLAPASGDCGGQFYETVTIQYEANLPPSEPVSCERSGIEEFCAPGEGCCNCGCGVVTNSCLQEIACPAHTGPICGTGQCREGTICCDTGLGYCAASEAECPD